MKESHTFVGHNVWAPKPVTGLPFRQDVALFDNGHSWQLIGIVFTVYILHSEEAETYLLTSN